MQPSPILGGHGQARSLNLADNQCWNLYVQLHPTKDGKEVGTFQMAPGLDLLATVGTGPVRGLHVAGGILYVASGNAFFSVTPAWVVTNLGTLQTGSGPVSIIDSGPFGQVALFDGALGYLYTLSTGAFGILSLPFTGGVQATYQDDFGLVYVARTQEWFQSNAGDLSTWQALAFTSADGSSDLVGGIISIHREVWVMKQNHVEIWLDAGTQPFAFARLDGVFLEQGIHATFSLAIGGEEGENLFWLAQAEQGERRVVVAQGYAVKTISTPAMQTELASYLVASDAIGYCYEQEGEVFYVLTFPSAGVTWAYNVRSGLWAKRGAFVNGQWARHAGNCYASFAGRRIVGDYASGNLYGFNLDNATDNGTARKWLRSWRALAKPSPVPVRFDALVIDMETGMQVAPGFNPQVMLRWSDDGGHNWSAQRQLQIGASGQTAQRVRFNRLGSTKLNSGLDRIFELSSSDPFKVAITAAYIV